MMNSAATPTVSSTSTTTIAAPTAIVSGDVQLHFSGKNPTHRTTNADQKSKMKAIKTKTVQQPNLFSFFQSKGAAKAASGSSSKCQTKMKLRLSSSANNYSKLRVSNKENKINEAPDARTNGMQDEEECDDIPLAAMMKKKPKNSEVASMIRKAMKKPDKNSAKANEATTNTNANGFDHHTNLQLGKRKAARNDTTTKSGKKTRQGTTTNANAGISHDPSNSQQQPPQRERESEPPRESFQTAMQFLNNHGGNDDVSAITRNKVITLEIIEKKVQVAARKRKADVEEEEATKALPSSQPTSKETTNVAATKTKNETMSDKTIETTSKMNVKVTDPQKLEANPSSDSNENQNLKRSKNLVHQLVDRTLLGSRGRRIHTGPRHAQSLQIQSPPLIAKSVPWIRLGSHHHGSGSAQQYTVDCLAWDPLGVLLAVANTCNITKQSWIDIYDWDTVCAADKTGRNAYIRSQATNDKSLRLALDIPPMMQFRIPSSTQSASQKKTPWMKWNPHHPDQLAVPSRCGSTVYVFNISNVESASATGHPGRIIQPPRHSYWKFSRPAKSQQPACSCLFVANDHIVISFGSVLFCWCYFPKRDPTSRQPRLKWQYDFNFKKVGMNRAAIVAMELIGREHLITGSSHGHMALIQWKRVISAGPTSSFSMASSNNLMSPTVLCQWVVYGSLQVPPEQQQDPSIMGVQQIQVEEGLNTYSVKQDSESNVITTKQKKAPSTKQPEYEQLCGRFRILVVARCGWVLSVRFIGSASPRFQDYKIRREKPSIQHSTDPIVTKLASGGRVSTTKKEWSLPTEPVTADASPFFLCWQNVPSITRILPHHDQRVLHDGTSTTRDVMESNQLLFRTQHQLSRLQSITLPKRKGRPCSIAVDPSHQEWFVIGSVSNDLYVVHLRRA